MKKELSSLDNAIYYILVVFTLGSVFFTKVIVKKAISEMEK